MATDALHRCRRLLWSHERCYPESGERRGDQSVGCKAPGRGGRIRPRECAGYRVLGQLAARTAHAVTRRAVQLIRRERHPVCTLTADYGTEFHDYATLQRATGTCVYFATLHHAWERGTNENTNGLLWQCLPKGASMAHLTQRACDALARRLNTRPRKRLGFRNPEECYAILT